MPSNPYKEEIIIRQKLNNMMHQLITLKKDIHYWDFVHNILLTYPVSERWVHNYINNFYVRKGLIKIENDIIKIKEQVE